MAVCLCHLSLLPDSHGSCVEVTGPISSDYKIYCPWLHDSRVHVTAPPSAPTLTQARPIMSCICLATVNQY